MANPDPSPATRFKKGQSGNPSGRSSEELKAISESARISAILREKTLSSLQERFKDKDLSDDDLLILLSTGALKLFKDSEDRAHGTPQQSVNMESPNGTLTPKDALPLNAKALAALAKSLTS